MKHIKVVLVVVFALLIMGCERPGDIQARSLALSQKTAGNAIASIQYVKDTRTGLCFAYHWGGDYHGGPAFATVPCEVVPSHLLMSPK